LEKVIKAKVKEIAENEKKFKVEILALDFNGKGDLIYFADSFAIDGDFIRFTPKRCLSKLKSYDMAEMELVLPSNRVLEITIRK
jgi:hypothetical protein